MSFKVGERIVVTNILGPLDKDGEPVKVLCDVTATAKGHVLASLIFVSEGFVFAVKKDGNHAILKSTGELPKDAQRLAIGELTALPFADITSAQALVLTARTGPELSRDEVKEKLHLSDDLLDAYISKKTLTPLRNGKFSSGEIAAIETHLANITKEQRKYGDKAKEFNKLGRELHPEIFERPW